MAALAVLLLGNSAPIALRAGSNVHLKFGPASEAVAAIHLNRGESADIAVVQRGIDVVVRLRDTVGKLLDEIDSPNGRNGDEPVNIYARVAGDYRLEIRPISPTEPKGAIDIEVRAMRTAARTARDRHQEAQLRRAAADWLRRKDAPLPAVDRIAGAGAIAPLDELGAAARVIGLGEATHGSRELNDVRLALLQRLVGRHGYRVIAIEDSVDQWRLLEPYISGAAASPGAPEEWGWIGRRTRKQLVEWARSWNLRHPGDRVRIVGVDAQRNGVARDGLGPLLARAYGDQLAKAWPEHLQELSAADEQTLVFGNSDVKPQTRDFLQNLLARLITDEPVLKRRLGDQDYERALDYTRELAAFADFNGGSGPLAKSRDWYMASMVLRAIDDAGPGAKGIYWGHNAHVSSTPAGTAGALLREALGCRYRAIAMTFGQGGFLAQLPNDLTDRLRTTTVAAADEESVESVLAEVRRGAHIASWQCGPKTDRPPWLADAHRMRWVGGIYAPESAPSASYRPYRLTDAFDAVVYIPNVEAEGDPGDQPVIPARKR